MNMRGFLCHYANGAQAMENDFINSRGNNKDDGFIKGKDTPGF